MQWWSNTTFTLPPPLLLPGYYSLPLVPQGAELCNLRADKSRFGEILEAETLLKLPVFVLWKSQQLELPWDWIRMDIEPEKLLSGSCSAHSGPQHIHTHTQSQIVLLNGRWHFLYLHQALMHSLRLSISFYYVMLMKKTILEGKR